MAIDTATPRSRRALLVAALGAGAATVASALGRPSPALATNGGSILLGTSPSAPLDGTGSNEASATTAIHTTNGAGFFAETAEPADLVGTGILGWAHNPAGGMTFGVRGESDSTKGRGVGGLASAASGTTYGVWGRSDSTAGIGVHGTAVASSGATRGVWGVSASPDGTGVRGDATALSGMNDGVRGSTSSADGAGVKGIASAPSGGTRGVYGEALSPDGIAIFGKATSASGATRGVLGIAASPDGSGVHGLSGSSPEPLPVPSPKTGVFGYAAQDANAIGVKGESPSGTGVLAATSTGTALRVAGRASFARSGRGTVAKGRSYCDITVAGGLTSRSMIHATIQAYRPGVAVAAVRANYPSAGRARIYLTKVASTTASTSVGWFVADY